MARYVPKDAGYRRAKNAGYRSRAALKLLELNRRFRLLRPGLRVLDLGCWPGGWLQVVAEEVGPAGIVVGVDTQKVEPLSFPNVSTIVGDVADERVLRSVQERLGGRADVVLSDLSAKLTGVRDVDTARHLALCEITAARCADLLTNGGSAVVKLFSDSERQAVEILMRAFGSCVVYRPEATRKGSSEIYVVGRDFRC